jgi:serine/threonine protein kinase/Tol biopolymer transport system component
MEITPDKWQGAKAVFDAVLQRPRSERESFLASVCTEGDLREQVEQLLRNHEQAGSFLSKPLLPRHAGQVSSNMSLAAGTRLGPYEIVAPAGAGGMGEVYRAKDTRLGRTVAIKVLPSDLADNPDLQHRFEHEARCISKLSHPNICTLHDVGHENGVHFLVLEYLDGETLERRLQKGRLSTEHVLQYAVQIADALDKAHRQGITHRDLKPGNIMLTKSGAKLLDFGLAKWAAKPVAGPPEITVESLKLTTEGTLLGTLPYMAPEQLEGKPADPRTDIFALGTVIYEMATGQQAFIGKSRASLIAAILSSAPPAISSVHPLSPRGLDRVVNACMEKDPELRWQSAYDVKLQLTFLAEQVGQPDLHAEKGKRSPASVLAGILLLIVMLVGYFLWPSHPAPTPDFRFTVFAPEKTGFETIAISPDGQRVAFFAGGALWVRSFSSLSAQRILTAEESGGGSPWGFGLPFWSADGKWIAFFAQGKLKKVQAIGGFPEIVCAAPQPAGWGSWNREDIILFTPDIFHVDKAGIFRVSAMGGEPVAVTKVDTSRREGAHVSPYFLPDGRHFLYLAGIGSGRRESRSIYLGSLDGSASVRLLQSDSQAIYVRDHLLFLRDRTLLAQPFDVRHFRLRGAPVPLARDIEYFEPHGLGFFSTSETGVLVYGADSGMLSRLVWLDRRGKEIQTVGSPASYLGMDLSPDEKRIVTERMDPQSRTGSVWVTDLIRGTSSRITFNPSWEYAPIWSPDGNKILFDSNRGQAGSSTPGNLYVTAANGGGTEEPFLRSDPWKWPDDWSRDGRLVLFHTLDADNGKAELWVLPVYGDRNPRPALQADSAGADGQFSPDGKWISYVSAESGRDQIYVQTFPASGEKWQISNGGGSQPRWRSDGKELFFIAATGELMVVQVSLASKFQVNLPQILFKARWAGWGGRHDYAVSRDGQRFLAIVGDENATPLTVLTNWAADLPH